MDDNVSTPKPKWIMDVEQLLELELEPKWVAGVERLLKLEWELNPFWP